MTVHLAIVDLAVIRHVINHMIRLPGLVELLASDTGAAQDMQS